MHSEVGSVDDRDIAGRIKQANRYTFVEISKWWLKKK